MGVHKFVIHLWQDQEFILSQIGNADQAPMNFDLPMSRTFDQRGARSVRVKTTDAKKQRFMVMLAITANGRKLLPHVIFKMKTLPKANFPSGIHIQAQEKGWMSPDLTADWVCTVWGQRPGALILPSLLVLDSFCRHLGENIRWELEELRIEIAIIPGGLTSVLQSLDVCVSKPFKDSVRHLYRLDCRRRARLDANRHD